RDSRTDSLSSIIKRVGMCGWRRTALDLLHIACRAPESQWPSASIGETRTLQTGPQGAERSFAPGVDSSFSQTSIHETFPCDPFPAGLPLPLDSRSEPAGSLGRR